MILSPTLEDPAISMKQFYRPIVRVTCKVSQRGTKGVWCLLGLFYEELIRGSCVGA